MKVREIREIAKKKGITGIKKMTKTELIRTIQRTEGNNPCFATRPVSQCDQVHCLWREDCALAA